LVRILVIDDNEDVRSVVSGVLEAAGYEVTVAPDGAQGIDAQRKSPARIVITDILMPNRDGIETIRDFRQEFPTVKIIAMSGAGQRLKNTGPQLFAAKELGANVVLRKPFAPAILLDSVRDMLRQPSE
jgi:CheY-like chemotaxis protein